MTTRTKNTLKTLKLNESTISTIIGALVVIVVGILIFNYFRQSGKNEIVPEASKNEGEISLETNPEGQQVPTNLPATHKVAAGEDLWAIALKYYGSGYNWVDINDANNLSSPDMITVDQELTVPKVAVRKVETLATQTSPEPVIQGNQNQIVGDTYKVREGDNLWDICVRAYADGYKWTLVAQANSITDPNLIFVDQELKLPR